MRRLGLLALCFIPAGRLLLTLSGHWHYGLFIFSRWVVSGGAAPLALVAHDQDASGWLWVMVGLLILFNPFVLLHLRRDTWRILDLLAAGIFVVAALRLQPSSHSHRGGTPA
jgi:hypothetical protein